MNNINLLIINLYSNNSNTIFIIINDINHFIISFNFYLITLL
jgi:hypothetical protein